MFKSLRPICVAIWQRPHNIVEQLSSSCSIFLNSVQLQSLIIISYSRRVMFCEYCSSVITNRMIFRCVLSITLYKKKYLLLNGERDEPVGATFFIQSLTHPGTFLPRSSLVMQPDFANPLYLLSGDISNRPFPS